jgi:hypothetical protein
MAEENITQLSAAMLKLQEDIAKLGYVTQASAEQLKDAQMKAKYGSESYTKGVNAAGQALGALAGAGIESAKAMYQGKKDATAFNASLGELAKAATLAGTALGGTVANNLIVTVATVGTAGKIATFGVVGTGRIGDGTVDVVVDVTGTSAIDTYVAGGASTEFTTTKTASAVTLASGLVSNLEIKLADHERVVFTDKAIAYDATGRAGDVYALLAAALGTADVTNAYKGIGIYLADAGWTNKQLAEALLATDTYKTDAGGVSNETFIKHVYKNVYGTNASLADVTALTTWMTINNYSQADVLVTASELSAFETTIGLVGLATTGIEYTPFVA